tara:strand:- start:1349 stop:1492 length:144 start_codon:yes stop_codon:yes gene_type:complete
MSAEQWDNLLKQLSESINKVSEKAEIVSAEPQRIDSLTAERFILSHH